MFVKMIEIKMLIRHSQSLKDKRRVVKSLKTKIRHKFNVSISEVAYLDDYKLAKLSIVMVSTSLVLIDREFAKIEQLLYLNGDFEVVDLAVSQI